MAKEPDVGGCDRMAPSGAIRRLCAKCCRPCFFRGTENDSSGAEVCVIRLAAGSLCQEIRTPGRGAGPGKEKKRTGGKATFCLLRASHTLYAGDATPGVAWAGHVKVGLCHLEDRLQAFSLTGDQHRNGGTSAE